MSKEEVIDHLKQCRADLARQNEIFSGTPSEELYEVIYENEIRMSELTRVIDYLMGEW